MRSFIFLICFFLLVACTPNQVLHPIPNNTLPASLDSTDLPGTGTPMNDLVLEISNPYSPQPGDENFSRANVYLDSSQINIMESYPVQINLYLQGSLPTPCHQLRVFIAQPDAEKRIQIELYSIVDPDKICVQMLQNFETSVQLGSFPTGNYSIWINGSLVGNFDS